MEIEKGEGVEGKGMSAGFERQGTGEGQGGEGGGCSQKRGRDRGGRGGGGAEGVEVFKTRQT